MPRKGGFGRATTQSEREPRKRALSTIWVGHWREFTGILDDLPRDEWPFLGMHFKRMEKEFSLPRQGLERLFYWWWHWKIPRLCAQYEDFEPVLTPGQLWPYIHECFAWCERCSDAIDLIADINDWTYEESFQAICDLPPEDMPTWEVPEKWLKDPT